MPVVVVEQSRSPTWPTSKQLYKRVQVSLQVSLWLNQMKTISSDVLCFQESIFLFYVI